MRCRFHTFNTAHVLVGKWKLVLSEPKILNPDSNLNLNPPLFLWIWIWKISGNIGISAITNIGISAKLPYRHALTVFSRFRENQGIIFDPLWMFRESFERSSPVLFCCNLGWMLRGHRRAVGQFSTLTRKKVAFLKHPNEHTARVSSRVPTIRENQGKSGRENFIFLESQGI